MSGETEENTTITKKVTTLTENALHYHLENSDRPGDQLVIHLLKGTNYSTWRRAITNALVSKHKMVFVDGRLPKPPEGDPNEENWITCNSMVMYWILNSLNEELHDSIVYHDIAQRMWRELEKRFSQGSGLMIQKIKEEISNTRQGDMTISAYYAKMKNLWEQLGTFSKPHKPGCSGYTCGVVTKEKEEEKLHQFVMGLNDAYKVVRSNLLCKDLLPSLPNAYSLLASEELTIERPPIIEAAAFKTYVDTVRHVCPNGVKM